MVQAWCFPEGSNGEQVAIFFNIVVKQKRQLGGGDFWNFFLIGCKRIFISLVLASHQIYEVIAVVDISNLTACFFSLPNDFPMSRLVAAHTSDESFF